MILLITKRNWLMKPLIGRWWRSNLYTRSELQAAFEQAAFSSISFRHFPLLYRSFDVWGTSSKRSNYPPQATCHGRLNPPNARVCEC